MNAKPQHNLINCILVFVCCSDIIAMHWVLVNITTLWWRRRMMKRMMTTLSDDLEADLSHLFK
jgi:hypothetical protein